MNDSGSAGNCNFSSKGDKIDCDQGEAGIQKWVLRPHKKIKSQIYRSSVLIHSTTPHFKLLARFVLLSRKKLKNLPPVPAPSAPQCTGR